MASEALKLMLMPECTEPESIAQAKHFELNVFMCFGRHVVRLLSAHVTLPTPVVVQSNRPLQVGDGFQRGPFDSCVV